MERRILPFFHINITTAAHIHILILISLVLVGTVTANAVEEKLQHKFLISKSEPLIFRMRRKRNENFLPSEYLNDYYANYYNEYYSNYYYNRVSDVYNNAPSRKSAIGSVGSFNDNNVNVLSAHGTKYTYTPIFKYKSTHQKRHKLFVPV